MISRLKILLLLFLCLYRYVIFGKATKRQKRFENIVIFQGAKLGDMVCTTPMFRAVKEKYPKSRLVVVGNTLNKHLLEHNLDVDSYIIHRDKETFSTIKKIKKGNVDFGCVTGPSFLNLAILYLAGIPLITTPVIKNGWSPHETRSYKFLRKLVTTKPHHMGQYAPREYLRLLEIIDIHTEDTTKHLVFSEEANIKAEELFSQYKGKILVGITLSAGNKIKEWPVARFAEVANYIASKYNAVIVIIGGPNDIKYSKEMKDSLNKGVEYIDTAGSLSIDDLKATITKLNLFISVDTGPIYIAEAFKVPTIDIIGPMDEREQPPIGKLHKVVVAPRKTAELHIMNAREYDKLEAQKQVEDISVQMVTEIFEELYPLIKK